MTELNKTAANTINKYVVQSTNAAAKTNSPKRGLQAEINKVEAIRRVIGTKDFDQVELFRFRTTINTLLQTIDFKMQSQCD
jgi:hypothetical protein